MGRLSSKVFCQLWSLALVAGDWEAQCPGLRPSVLFYSDTGLGDTQAHTLAT